MGATTRPGAGGTPWRWTSACGWTGATHADVASVEAHWLDEHDPHTNPMGSKGIGEIGIVGTAAAIANAAWHATGIRIRELPLSPEKFLR